MKRILIGILVFISIQSPSEAGSLKVAQWVPWNFLKSELLKENFEVYAENPEIKIPGDQVSPTAKGLQFDLKGKFDDLMVSSLGIKAIGSHLSATISIQELSVDEVIEREFNGNRIRVRIKATCSPLQISIPRFGAILDSEFKEVGTTFSPELLSFKLNLPHQGWTLSPFECKGLEGLGNEVAAIITTSLNDPRLLESFIKDWLRDQILEQWMNVWNSLKKSAEGSIKILSMGKPSDHGILLYGELPLKLNKDVPLSHIDEDLLSSEQPQLIVSHEGFQTILENQFIDLAPQKYNLQKQTAFANLMKSRIKQFFVWPDLQRFAKKAPFLLSINPHEAQISLTSLTASSWDVDLRANGLLQSELREASVNYINWGTTLKTTMSCKVVDGLMTLKTTTVKMEIAWYYNLLYRLLYKPNSRIEVDLIKSGIAQSFSNKEISQELPKLQWQGRTFKLQNWFQHPDLITMDWRENL